jgi:hypothetical protein
VRIYITHCSARKCRSLRNTGKKVLPDKLYTSSRIQRFMRRCKANGVHWAIFSDRYGVCFPREKHPWYEKPPSEVSKAEYIALLHNFETRLRKYPEIWFYYHPARFHKLYRKLLRECCLRRHVRRFKNLDLIS